MASRINFDIISDAIEQQNQAEITDTRRFDRLISTYNWNYVIEDCSYQEAYLKLVELFSTFRAMSSKTITIKKRRLN